MMVLAAWFLLCAGEERKDAKQEAGEQWEKGYDLPLKEAEQAEAATECEEIMEQIQNLYKLADKGETSNVVLQDETILEMQKAVTEDRKSVV